MQKITPFLWFDTQAEEAVAFYTSIFKDSRVVEVTRYGEGGPGPVGQVMVISFQLEGQDFAALNGGPHYQFTPAISLYVDCDTQDEVDELWEKLTEGGNAVQCGWLTDRYGVSWQIVPRGLTDLLYGEDSARSQRAMQAMLQMTKLDLAALQRAYNG